MKQANAQSIAKEIEKNWDFVLSKSLKNCHCFGLHSIVLSEEEGLLRRVFVARDWHELWKNHVSAETGKPFYGLSVAIHPHHCNIVLNTVKGNFINYEFVTVPYDPNNYLMSYLYESPITGESGKFVKKYPASLKLLETTEVPTGSNIKLFARQLHTVYVPKGQQAAWLVEETNEDAFYKPICYSNDALEWFSFEGMYRPMSEETLTEIVNYLKQ